MLKGRKKEDVEKKARDAESAIALLLYAMSDTEIEKKIENLEMTEELKDVEKMARRMKVRADSLLPTLLSPTVLLLGMHFSRC